MKYLADYMNEQQSVAFETAGAFFAFSNRQFDEAKKPDTKYMNLGGGLICPENTAKWLVSQLDTIYKQSIVKDMEENGIEGIIKRELQNHEAYYTGDIESTVKALSDYPISLDLIKYVYRKERAKNKEVYIG